MPRNYAYELYALQELIGTPCFVQLLSTPPNGTDSGVPTTSSESVSFVQTGYLCAANSAPVSFTGGSSTVSKYFQLTDINGKQTYWDCLPHDVCLIDGLLTIATNFLMVSWTASNQHLNIGSIITQETVTASGGFNQRRMSQLDAVPSIGPAEWTLSTLYDGSSIAAILNFQNAQTARVIGPGGSPTLNTMSGAAAIPYPGLLGIFGGSGTFLSSGAVSAIGQYGNCGTFLFGNFQPSFDLGTFRYTPLLDTTRGNNAGLTSAGPDSLAF
jgi:hypothetical protein